MHPVTKMQILGVLFQNKVTKINHDLIYKCVKKQTQKDIKSITNQNLCIAYSASPPITFYQKNFNDTIQFFFGVAYDNEGNQIDENSLVFEKIEAFGEYFINNYWGEYLLFSYQNRSRTLAIFRNPTSKPYLFYKIVNDKVIFASSIKLLIDYLDKKPNFYLPYIQHYIKNHFVDIKETPFIDISELSLATRIIFKDNKIIEKKFIWDLLKFASVNISIKDFEERFIDLMKMLMSTKIGNTKRIILDYSGGFDSTTLLYFIKKYHSDRDILALNFHDKDVNSSNELLHARKITEDLSVKLIELELSSLLPFDEINLQDNVFPNWPTANMVYYKKFTHISQTYINYNNNIDVSYFSGHGGDDIFMCPPSMESLTDYYIDHGIFGLLDKIHKFSLIDRNPLLSLVSFIVKDYIKYIFRKPKAPCNLQSKLNSINWLQNVSINSKITDPYKSLHEYDSITPGKRSLIKSIMMGLSTTKCNLNNNTQISYPFFSQKLIELCLSFPTYDSYQSGYDRFHARSAVANHFQSQFVWRKSKGETSGILQKGIIKNYRKIMELCMDGVCARNGIINRDLLHRSINNLKNGINEHQWPISSIITAEIFYKTWQKKKNNF